MAADFAVLSGKRVFLTGHTGFKGSWLIALLNRLGAKVTGYALAPETEPNLYELVEGGGLIERETIGDIRDRDALVNALTAAQPDLVIHMAARAFVRQGYRDPVSTWDVNVMGTVNLLEACRTTGSVKGILVVTTDKCYTNRGWEWGYRETDRLGGHDPYSASKAGTELVVESYRRSFFAESPVRLVSARAGNVIGGGDWSPERLIADAARAAMDGKPLLVRNPASTRPWQHVLDCLGGYLSIAGRLADGRPLADAYNFGPDTADNVTVGEVLDRLSAHWPELSWTTERPTNNQAMHEAAVLYLDSARARRQLDWRPRWGLDKALEKTATWYRLYSQDAARARQLTMDQIDEFLL